MGESSQHQRSRLGLRNSGGEIVEVQGGHIVRSTGRKDRHSKVCTAKGPRDRRVRLAAHTAIQFYDVQDRLGYDRPSKAVDWLIKKAKTAIDELAELPAWHPTKCLEGGEIVQKIDEEGENRHNQQQEEQQQQQQQQQLIVHHADTNPQNSSFLPPALDSDAIADTIKSFFPMGASAEASSSSMPQFQSFQSPNLLSRNNSNNNSQDLRLSLQSLQEPIMLHHNPHPQHQQQQTPVLLSGTPLGFDSTTPWPEHHHFQRLAFWNSSGDAPSGSGGGAAAGYLFNSTPPQLLSHNHNQFFSQRGPLQSSNTPSVRAWIDPSAVSAMADHSHHHHLHSPPIPVYPSSISGIGFPSGIGGFPGFHIPTRIQGDEEEHDGYSDKPSSASSDSRR